MSSIEKCLVTSAKNDVVYILYDHQCSLCRSAVTKASHLLKKRKVCTMALPESMNKEFLMIYHGEQYKSEKAWLKIFIISDTIFSKVENLYKIPGFLFMTKIVYNIVSKLRKLFKTKDCNCK